MGKSEYDELPVMSERRTLELCGDALRGAVRCVLDRGHGGDHQFISPHIIGPLTWKQRASQAK